MSIPKSVSAAIERRGQYLIVIGDNETAVSYAMKAYEAVRKLGSLSKEERDHILSSFRKEGK